MRSEASQAKLSSATELAADASDRAFDPSLSAASLAARCRVFSGPSATPRSVRSRQSVLRPLISQFPLGLGLESPWPAPNFCCRPCWLQNGAERGWEQRK
ncbi:hypothetical protein BS78_10G158000 [Paspalum vaginatum]|nr:hypothetical protein BS78_10G158000 [Paspalum vaginatum]